MKKIVKYLAVLVVLAAVISGCFTTVFAEEDPYAPEYLEPENGAPVLENENPLTGLYDLSAEAAGKRPVAVMINNHPANYPQWNIGQADVIFEVVVEHTLTRFLALFADYTKVPYLVSVRSYRYYFPALSEGFDAYYIHWGEDQTMMWYYDDLNLDSYDGMSNDFLFGRDQERLDMGYDLEHTSYFDGRLLPEQLEWDGVRTDLDVEHKGPAFNFVENGTVRTPEGNSCEFVDIQFGEQTAQFTYDEENAVYQKYANEEPQIDGITGEQLEFTNVIVLYTLIFDREDEPEADRKLLDVFGGLNEDYAVGYYVSNGAVQPIKWAKDDERSRLKFYDQDDNEIQLNRGKTYIAYTYIDSADFEEEIPEEYR